MLSLELYVRALVTLLPAPVRAVATPVVDRLLAVWQWSRSLAQRARTGLARTVRMMRGTRDGILSLASEAYVTLYWLARVRLPVVAGWARDAAVRWATDRLREILASLAAVRAWAGDQVARVRGAILAELDRLRRWALDQVYRLTGLLGRMAGRVFGLWDTPERLAAWIVGAMWIALWRYAYGQLESIAEALWTRRQRLAVRALAEAEQIIGRIL